MVPVVQGYLLVVVIVQFEKSLVNRDIELGVLDRIR